jgi:hypothetical protein
MNYAEQVIAPQIVEGFPIPVNNHYPGDVLDRMFEVLRMGDGSLRVYLVGQGFIRNIPYIGSSVGYRVWMDLHRELTQQMIAGELADPRNDRAQGTLALNISRAAQYAQVCLQWQPPDPAYRQAPAQVSPQEEFVP